MTSKQGSGDGQRGSLADVLDRSFNVYIGSTFRRCNFDAVGGFDETMAQAEDFDMWVRLMTLGGQAGYADAVLGDYRIRRGSASANSGLMLLGNIKVYQKARAALAGNRHELGLIDRLIEANCAALALEHAIDKITAGETVEGLRELRAVQAQVSGAKWAAALAVWRICPALARPMLRWRRKANSRGAVSPGLFSLLPFGGS